MNASMSSKRKSIVSENSGELEQMGVQFREVDPFNLWVSATDTVNMPTSSSVVARSGLVCNKEISIKLTPTQHRADVLKAVPQRHSPDRMHHHFPGSVLAELHNTCSAANETWESKITSCAGTAMV